MKSFPMFFRTTGRRVVIIGGAEQAAQKARLILKSDADLVIVAAALDPELDDLVQTGRASHTADLSASAFDGAAFAFIATGCPGLDAAAHGLAQAVRCPVNVVDRPDLCDLTTPAIVDRDPIVVAIGSEGTAPVLTREIKTRLEELLPQNLGGLAALAGRLRAQVAACLPRAKRRAFWAWVFKGAPRRDWTQGREREAARDIKAAIAAGGRPQARQGGLSVIGSGPGARDLLTLRAVARLQEADVIFYDRASDAGLLELARRDAERVFIGAPEGVGLLPARRIATRVMSVAKDGSQIVWLTAQSPEQLASLLAREGRVAELIPGAVALPEALRSAS